MPATTCRWLSKASVKVEDPEVDHGPSPPVAHRQRRETLTNGNSGQDEGLSIPGPGGITTAAAPNTTAQPALPPITNLQAWTQVLASWCILFSTWGTIVTFCDYQAYYETDVLFRQSTANISWIGSLQTLMVFAIGALTGPIYDRGHLRPLLIAGTTGLVLGHMMLSLCSTYWQVVLAQGLAVGLGGGCLFVPSLAIIEPYFPEHHLGLAVGVATTGSSLGGIVFPVAFIALRDSIGFGWTARVIGFIALVVLAFPLCFSRMRYVPSSPRKLVDFSAFRDGPFVTCVLGCFLGYAGTQMTFFYLACFGQSRGWMPETLALYLLPILNATASFGRVVPNWLADRIGVVNVVIPGSLLIGIVLLCNLAVRSPAALVCLALLFGFASGVFVATPPLLFMRFTRDKAKLGSRMGIAFAVLGLSVLPGDPGAAAVLDHDPAGEDWTAAWVYAGGLPLLAVGVFVGLRVWEGGWRVMVKV